jgi:hypothetical protein
MMMMCKDAGKQALLFHFDECEHLSENHLKVSELLPSNSRSPARSWLQLVSEF